MGFLPDFRKIYRDSRTDDEEKQLIQYALTKGSIFVCACAGLILTRYLYARYTNQ